MSSPESRLPAVAARQPNMPTLLSPKTPHQSHHHYRSSSPNYFGLVVDPASSSVRSAGGQPQRASRTPSSANVHSAAAMSPQTVPLSSNSDYDDFKKQLGFNRINLSKQAALPGSSNSPLVQRTSSQDLGSAFSKSGRRRAKTPPSAIGTSESTAGEDLLQPPRSPPKRGLSGDVHDDPNRARRQSPADFNEHGVARSLGSPPLRNQDKPSKDSLMEGTFDTSGPGSSLSRTQSVPVNTLPQSPLMLFPNQIRETLTNNKNEILLLDMRVATQYAHSRISGALNLCIPTTLLKRPSYNIQRLADTFKEDAQKAEFARWQSDDVIMVYDNASSQQQEAHSCINILKKFASEGWRGKSLIIRGGFTDFAKTCPDLIDESSLGGAATQADISFRSESLELPPVMGGCPLPETESAVNPFFGNIRQNMDLIGGVGQIAIKCSPLLSEQDKQELPEWLKKAADEKNKGKRVSDKFLGIEQREKARMQEALSGEVVYNKAKPDNPQAHKVKVAGIEKGTKNRYHNILPFEHSRVKLLGVPEGGCNYVNASFLNTSISQKKYIATQSPVPATFNDFWNMVWQRDIRVIVMLTPETEGNQIKAHNYWNGTRYGPIKLQLHSEHRASLEPHRVLKSKMRPHLREQQRRFSSMMLPSEHDPAVKGEDLPSAAKDEPYVLVRKFSISHDSFPFERMREVTQLHFSAWPDFGVPTHPSHLLGLIEQCNAVMRASSKGAQASEQPVLVHCSAGCGRTGTFCTVDTVVDALKRQGVHAPGADRRPASGRGGERASQDMDVDDEVGQESESRLDAQVDLIEKAVDEFRLQRLSMVQSLDQFVLCYETVLEWIAEQKQPPVTA